MRPLFYDFYKDETTYEIGDEYMFGPELLVAPAIEKGAVQRKVYLPKGAEWTEAYTKVRYKGGTWVNVDAPLERIPVFYKNDIDLNLF